MLGNCHYWNKVNKAWQIPKICIRGDYNFAFYEGEKGCTVLMDVKNRDHGQTFDDAQLVWDYLFSGSYRDENGVLSHQLPNKGRDGDTISIAAADGCSRAWVNHQIVEFEGTPFLWQKLKYHGLNGKTKVRGEYLYVSIQFLEKVFSIHAASEEGQTAELVMKNKSVIQFAKGNIGCVVDNKIEAMSCEGVWYATDHPASISRHMAYLLQNILTENQP